MSLKACIAAVLSLVAAPAGAWGPDGHQTVGAIADRLIAGTPAAAKVKSLLGGLTLRDAADWADCARGVGPAPAYAYDEPGKHPACAPFETSKGIAEMRDYVRRNDRNCVRKGHEGSCHTQYHFVDIAPQRGRYDSDAPGASPVDIVAATTAAIRVLRGQPAPKPFDIRSRREALLMLAHFVGDLHQPLHVGSIYLDKAGHPLDPGAGPVPAGSSTAGGNAVVPIDAVTHKAMGKLHGMWDDIPAALLSGHLDAGWLAEAQAVEKDEGDAAGWPAGWATGTLLASRDAYAKIRFAAKQDDAWNATLPLKYRDHMTALKHRQLTLAGARLAQVLQATLGR